MQRNGDQHFGHFHSAPLDFRSNAFGYGVAKRTRQVYAPAEFQPQQQSVHRIVIGKRNNRSVEAGRPGHAAPAHAGEIGLAHSDPAAGTGLRGAGKAGVALFAQFPGVGRPPGA